MHDRHHDRVEIKALLRENRHEPPPNGSGIRVSEEFAVERVYALARMFNGVQILTDGAPRRKDIVEGLDKLELTAAAFADVLESLAISPVIAFRPEEPE
jgi:hypothetical protein